MKKLAIFGAILVLLIVGSLFLTTRISTAHAAAVELIRSSSVSNAGEVNYILLTKFSQARGPTGKGCTVAQYFVSVGKDGKWLKALITSDGYKHKWVAKEIVA